MAKTSPTKPAPVLAYINMKGGVGKTTLSANVTRAVFRANPCKTLLIDLDAQLNLTQLLLTRAEYELLLEKRQTVYHVLEPSQPESVFIVSEDDHVDVGDIDEYTTILETDPTDNAKQLRLLPGDFRLAKLNVREHPALRVSRNRFESFITKAREANQLVVIDCNPSSSFTTRCAIEVATHLVIPVKPDKFSILGVEMLTQFIKELPTIRRTPATFILLNDTKPESNSESFALRAHPLFGPQVLVSEIRHSRHFSAKTDYTGFAADKGGPYSDDIAKLLQDVAAELTKKLI